MKLLSCSRLLSADGSAPSVFADDFKEIGFRRMAVLFGFSLMMSRRLVVESYRKELKGDERLVTYLCGGVLWVQRWAVNK
jgi:hypothetical protein